MWESLSARGRPGGCSPVPSCVFSVAEQTGTFPVFRVPTHSYQAWAVRPAEAKGSDYIWAVTLPKTDFLSPAGQDWS